MAMPSRTIVSAVAPRSRLKLWITRHASIAQIQALAAVRKSPPTDRTLPPRTIGTAAPKLAAAEMPSVNGSASGLLRIVCIWAPAIASAAPTTTDITAIGSRMSQMIACSTGVVVQGVTTPASASDTVRSEGPSTTSANTDPSSIASSRTTSNLRRWASCR